MKKNIILLLIGFILFIPKADASSVSLYASSGEVTRGNTATITAGVNADSGIYTIRGTLSCSGAGVSGGVSLDFEDLNTASTSKSYSYTIKPTESGTVTCTVSGVNIRELSHDSEYSLDSKTINVSVKDPVVVAPKQYSSNNNLKSLSIEGFDLDKSFDKNTLEYSIEVPNDTTKVNIKASVEDENASVKGSGEVEVSEGLNKIEIKVTAENGNEKVYVINVTVKELDPIEITVDKNKYTIIRKEGIIDAPEGFEKTTIKIGEDEVLAYTNANLKMTLVGLKDGKGNSKYYIYDDGKYKEYKALTANGVTIVLTELDKNKIPNGYSKTTFLVDNEKFDGYTLKKGSKFYLVYGKNILTGKEELYQYDSKEGTLQRYNDEYLDIITSSADEVKKYKTLLIAFSSVFGLSILTLIIVLVVKKNKNKNKKHKKIELADEVDI